MAPYDVRLLGGLRVESGGVVLDVGPRRVRELLTLLLLERGDAIARERLAYRLWPDSSERQARTNLRQALHQLRSRFVDAERLLHLDGHDLHVRPDVAIDFDVDRFERQLILAAAARDAGDLPLERRALEAAVAAYAGDLVPELYAAWVEPHRARLHEACARGLERLITVLRTQGDEGVALDVTQRLIEHDPLSERGHRVLIELFERRGERAKALHAYHSCASLLRRELDVEPAAPTQALYERLVRLERPGTGTPGESGQHAGERPAAPPPLVGRRDELAALHDAWRRSSAGQAQLVFVTGDAGIGKTRLVEEFAAQLRRRQVKLAFARCYEAEGALAYAPVATLLRSDVLWPALAELDVSLRRELSRLLPEARPGAEAPTSSGLQRTRLFEALARTVRAAQPLALVVDNLHWADHDTLEWLHYVLRYDRRGRLLLLATARSDEVAASETLQHWLTTLRDEGRVLEIDLAPLDLAESAEMARSLCWRTPTPAELDWLFSESEGNPLFLLELVRAGMTARSSASQEGGEGDGPSALPPRLRAVIGARLERLPPEAFEMALTAAVIGRAFDLDLLVRVCRCDDDAVVRAVDELWRRRVVREQAAGQYDFSHDKLREVAYHSLSLTRRLWLHRLVAEALEGADADDREALSGRIAHHYDRADMPQRAIEAYLRAAQVARRRYAEAEAAGHYARALTLLEALPEGAAEPGWRDRVMAEAHEGLGDVAERRAHHATARDEFALALTALPAHDRLARARLWRRIGDTWTGRYRCDEAARSYETAERVLALGDHASERPEALRERIEIALARADLHYWQHRWGEGERDLMAVSDLATRHASAHQLGRLYYGLALMHFSRDRQTVSAACLELARSGHEAGQRTGDTDVIMGLGFGYGFMSLWHGDLDAAEALLRAVFDDAERVGDAMRAVRSITYLGFVARLRGDADALRAAVETGLRVATEVGVPEYVGAAHGQRAWLAWRAGDLDGCEREGAAALDAWRSGLHYPLQWVARLPLMAACLQRACEGEAPVHAQMLLEPGQQRQPDTLAAALSTLVAAHAGGAAASRLSAALVSVIEAARSVGRM